MVFRNPTSGREATRHTCPSWAGSWPGWGTPGQQQCTPSRRPLTWTHTSPPGLERYTHVPGGRGVLHIPGALAHASGVLGRVHAGEADGRAGGGVPRVRLGLLQQKGLQVYTWDMEVLGLRVYQAAWAQSSQFPGPPLPQPQHWLGVWSVPGLPLGCLPLADLTGSQLCTLEWKKKA